MSESLSPSWPPASKDDRKARVLLALLHVYAIWGRATVREVSIAAGVSLSRTHDLLDVLREEGCCTWDHGCMGTLRPLVAEVVR